MSNTKMMTPECKGKYIWLYTPNTKFNPDGDYSVTCIMEDTPEWTHLVENIKSEFNAYYDAQCKVAKRKLKKCEHTPWKKETVNEEETGLNVFIVKNKGIGRKKDGTTFETKPVIYGPDLEPLKETELQGTLGEGTTLKCGFSVNLWQNDAQGVGVSARLIWSQIINPVYHSPFAGFDAGEIKMKKYPKDFSMFKPANLFNSQGRDKPKDEDEDEALCDEEFLQTLKHK